MIGIDTAMVQWNITTVFSLHHSSLFYIYYYRLEMLFASLRDTILNLIWAFKNLIIIKLQLYVYSYILDIFCFYQVLMKFYYNELSLTKHIILYVKMIRNMYEKYNYFILK